MLPVTLKERTPHIAILLLPFALFSFLIPGFSEYTLGNDYGLYAAHEELELQSALKHGDFPLFVPGFACGRDAAALTLGRLYHPLPHLAASIPGYFDGAALTIITILRLAALGLAHLLLFCLLTRLKLQKAPAFLISFITVYNLRMLDLFRYGASLENYTAHLYLIAALGFYCLRPTRIVGPATISGSVYLLVCGGHPQMMYYGLLAAGVAAAVMPYALPSILKELAIGPADRVRYYKVVALSMLGGIFLSSAYIIPFCVEFLVDNAVRIDRGYGWSLSNSDNLGGALGNFFFAWRSDVHGAFGGSSLIALLVPLPLLTVWKLRPPKVVWILSAVYLVVFLIGQGDMTPLHFWFWKVFPLASAFRTPGRIFMMLPSITMFLLAYLVSRSEPISFRGIARPIAPLFPIALAALVLTAVFFGLNEQLSPPARFVPAHIHERPPWADILFFAAGMLSLTCIATLAVLTRRSGRLQKTTTLLLIASTLLQVGLSLRFGTWETLREDSRTFTEYCADKAGDLRTKVTSGYGMESALVTEQLSRSILEPKLAKLYRHYAAKSSEKEVLTYLAASRQADHAVIEAAVDPPSVCTSATNEKVRLVFSSYNDLRFEIVAPCGGLFSLAFPYSTNWLATVDDEPTTVFKANGYETAVVVPKDAKKVTFSYRSSSHTAGLAVSATAFAAIVLLLAAPIRERRPRLYYPVTGAAVLLSAATFGLPLYLVHHPVSFNTAYRWSSSDLPAANNLAYAKTTRMSPMMSDENPYYQYGGRAVDGDRNARGFLTTHKRRGLWQVDLGSVQPVRRIEIFGDEDTTPPFVLSASTDGKAFQPIVTLEKRTSNNAWHVETDVDARYIRIRKTAKGSLTLKEVEVYGP